MKRHLAPAMLCALPLAAIIAGCSGGTGGLSGLGSSVTTPSTINTKLTPVPTAATATATPAGTATPLPEPANQSFALAITGPSTDYKGTGPTGLPLTKAELKTEKGVSTLAITYGAVTSPFEIALIKKGAFAAGDVFTFGAKKGARAVTKFTTVTAEEPPVVFDFLPAKTPATAKITAINGTNYTIELNDVGYSDGAKVPATFSLKGTVVVGLYEGKVG